ncbi:ABC transporter substrate-binding protein [Microbacterium sp. YY-01]|uniref:ABC transporter substrate-binding protein n=1 Tax=Microbacterium sp. YY-01 TaxID=3421634 RepID=UPI003D1661C3
MILVIGVVGSLGAVTACGSGGGAPADDGRITVTFWQNKFSNEDNAWFKKAVDDYNKSQDGIRVELTVVPGDAWDQKLKAAQAAGKAPDMYTMNYSAVPMNARNQQLAPITEHIDAAAWDDLDPRFLDAVTVEGKQYAYPLYYEPSALLFYREDLFTAAGLDPDSPPTTWAELIEAGETLQATDAKTIPFQIAQNAVELSWSTWGAQKGTTGHLAISDDWSQATVTDDYKPLFEFYQDLYAKKIIAKQALSAYGDATPLGQGKLAMMAAGSWAISQLLADYDDMVGKLRVAPMPTVDGDTTRTTSTLGGWTIGVDARSQHVAEASDAIGWMLAGDIDVPKAYFTGTMYTKLSPRISVDEALAAGDDSSVNPFYDVLTESTATAILEPTYDWQVSLAVGTALEKAMLGGDIDEAMAEANQKIEKVIKDLGLAKQPH